jgi:hypothetical protein
MTTHLGIAPARYALKPSDSTDLQEYGTLLVTNRPLTTIHLPMECRA